MHKKIIISSILLFLFFLLFCHFYDDFKLIIDKFASFATIIGFIIVIFQIIKLRTITEETRKTANETKDKFFFFICATDIAKAIKIIDEIQDFNRSKRIESSLLRMKDLRYEIIKLKNSTTIASFISSDTFQKHLLDLATIINSFDKAMCYNEIEKIDFSKYNEKLYEISNTLSDIETQLKQIGGQYNG